MARGDEEHNNPKPDIEIAQAAAMRPIAEIAAETLGIPADAVLPCGGNPPLARAGNTRAPTMAKDVAD